MWGRESVSERRYGERVRKMKRFSEKVKCGERERERIFCLFFYFYFDHKILIF